MKNQQKPTKPTKNQHSEKVRNFIKVYAGSVKEAAAAAGIKYSYARELMTRPDIVEAIKNRNKVPPPPPGVMAGILTREEIEKWLTDRLRDPNTTEVNKMRAVDRFCKLNCLYAEKRVLEGSKDNPLEVTVSERKLAIEERKKLLGLIE